MSNLYIIRNCPCYDHDYEECLNTFRDEYKKCYDCTDCVMKQIYDLCNHYKDVDIVALQVTKLLQIEEVE